MRCVAAAGDAPGAAARAGKDHGNLEAVGGDTGMGHAVEDGPVRFTFRTGLEWGVGGTVTIVLQFRKRALEGARRLGWREARRGG